MSSGEVDLRPKTEQVKVESAKRDSERPMTKLVKLVFEDIVDQSYVVVERDAAAAVRVAAGVVGVVAVAGMSDWEREWA